MKGDGRERASFDESVSFFAERFYEGEMGKDFRKYILSHFLFFTFLFCFSIFFSPLFSFFVDFVFLYYS